jgi:hypothetical protein
MNREDLETALVGIHAGAIYTGSTLGAVGARHVTTWVQDDAEGNPKRAVVTVHAPYSAPRTVMDAFKLLDSMWVAEFSVRVEGDRVKAVARHLSAEVELVVALGSAVQALTAIPQPRDGEGEVTHPADDHDRDDAIYDARLDHLLHGVEL